MQGRVGALDDEGFSHVVSRARSARAGTKAGGRSRKSGRAAAAAAVAAAAGSGADADSKETERQVAIATAGVAKASRELEASAFFEALKLEVGAAVVASASPRWVIACLGLGSPIGSSISQWQLACLGLLRSALASSCAGASVAACRCLDPCFSAADEAVIAGSGSSVVIGDLGVTRPKGCDDGCCPAPEDGASGAAAARAADARARQQWQQLTHEGCGDAGSRARPGPGAAAECAPAKAPGSAAAATDEEGAGSAAGAAAAGDCAGGGDEPLPALLLFMPHCPAQLYDAVIGFAGAEGRLGRTVLVGNALSMYAPEAAAAAGPSPQELLRNAAPSPESAAAPAAAPPEPGAARRRRRGRQRGALAPRAAPAEAPTPSTCPVVQELLRSGSLPSACAPSAPPSAFVVSEARVDVDGAGRRREFGACDRDSAAHGGPGATRLASLGVQTHPSAKGDPVLLAFTGTAVHRFRPAAR